MNKIQKLQDNLNITKKILRKQNRYFHLIEKETGIKPCLTQTKNLIICNAGLVNGLTEEAVINAFMVYGAIEKVILLPGKSCGFVCYKSVDSAKNAYDSVNGVLNIAQDNKPLYLLYSETVPVLEHVDKSLPPGLILLENFVSEAEESLLLSCIKWNESDSNTLKHRRVKHYGYEFRYDNNNVDKNSPLLNRIPVECEPILERFVSNNSEFNWFQADQLTVNEYQSGQGIPSHIDTHSAFEDPILSLSLGSAVIMEFRCGDEHVSVLLPARSLLIMSGEARYVWSHGITPRKSDIISSQYGLTVQERQLRTSFTFRQIRKTECNCSYIETCDSSQKRNKNQIESKLAEELESTHVYQVYEEIAPHFSDTRHKPWPNVLAFVNGLSPGSILIDVGCGNGKYLGHNGNVFEIGCDRSFNLIEICNNRGFQVFNCNCLKIPIKNEIADGVISIAVIHHLANEERRQQALREIVRILRIGGSALIYVWAKDQQKQNKSNYLKQDRKNRKNNNNDESKSESNLNETVNIGNDTSLPVHVNRTQFRHQDVLVPWKLKRKEMNENLFLRYYHVFDEGELETMCSQLENVEISKSYYDQGNWCVIIKKLSA